MYICIYIYIYIYCADGLCNLITENVQWLSVVECRLLVLYIGVKLVPLIVKVIYLDVVYDIYIYIFIILINNSQRKDKGNQWHDGGCISDTKFR